MDDRKRQTLLMMEEIVKGLDYVTAGDELAEQIVDYLDDDNTVKAHQLLCEIDSRYWDGPAQKRAVDSKRFAEVFARIIEHFGIHLEHFKSRGFSA